MARRKMAEDSPALPDAAAADEGALDERPMLSAGADDSAVSGDLPVAPPNSGPRLWPLLASGALVAAMGFGAAVGTYRLAPQIFGVMPAPGVDLRLSDHDKRLEDLAAQVAGLSPASSSASVEVTTALADQTAAIAALQEENKDVAAQIAELTAQLARLETMPSAADGATVAGVAAATQAANQAAEAARADAEKLQAEVRAIVRRADLGGALAALAVALENGQPLEPTLGKLAALEVALPPALTDQAQGVPTAAALRDAFPQAAREALALSLPETVGDSVWDRMTAFLRSQSGARSLTPRAGDDPDAILSRAEAQLRAGDLGAALDEVARLPETGRARMAEWTALAERRQFALAALNHLQAEAQ